MSLIFAPEPVAVVTPPLVVRPVAPRPDTRPVESSEKANAGSSEQKQSATRDPAAKAEPSPRPPGTDPSLPPQTLFDASLISEDFKPSTSPDQFAALALADPPGEILGDESSPSAADDRADSGDAAPFVPAKDDNHPVEAQQLAAYDRVQSGSPLSLPAAANPDWLNAIEKIA
ncbi:MAG: hypothetical protein KKH72_14320 [Alphaproteobacteria bacterium]|nr:hypothetical protein [Alphaproteobacteria bacterium]